MFKDEKEFEEIVNRLNIDTNPNSTHREKLRKEILSVYNETKQQSQKHTTPFGVFWRTIMRNSITKLAAAAVIIIAVTTGYIWFGGSLNVSTVAWADVVRPLLNAQTASLDIIIGSQGGAVIHDDVMGSRIRRTVSGINGTDIIIDLEQMKMLSLDKSGKTAVYLDLGGIPDIQNYLELLQNVVIRLQDQPGFHVENQGLEELNGRDYTVFVATDDNNTITIWADPETALPVRIEQQTPNMQIICDNLQFDIELDESLFNMEVPEGYTIKNSGIDFSKNSESDFIETLRIWAEVIEDGYFPDSINLEDVVKVGQKFDKGLKRLNLSEQEQVEIATKWGQGFVFIRFFKGQGQWHYAGMGVKLGDSETPIFWYQPKDSETWRVIYGDLSVKDVSEEELPEPSEWQTKFLEASKQWKEIAFTGKEIDTWHLTASGDIIAHSDITLTKISKDTNLMYIKLPYPDAVLETVTINNEQIQFQHIKEDHYQIELPTENLAEGSARIEFVWNMPLETLRQADNSFRTKLQGLLPVESFEVKTILDSDCGYQNSKDKSQTQVMYFKINSLFPISDSSSCRLSIEKIE